MKISKYKDKIDSDVINKGEEARIKDTENEQLKEEILANSLLRSMRPHIKL